MAAKKSKSVKHRFECKPVDDGVTEFTFVGLDGTEVVLPRLAFLPQDKLAGFDAEDMDATKKLLSSIAGDEAADYLTSLPMVYLLQFIEAWNADSEELLGK